MEIISVPAIVTIVYTLIELYKKWIARGREKYLAAIPVIALLLGGILGVAVYYIEPSIIVAQNVWVAVIVGMASGLSAVGGNQIFKQLKKAAEAEKDKKTDEE